MDDKLTPLIVGDAAAAGLGELPRARRFFGRTKRRERARAPLTNCENCGAPLGGDYCAQCGQHAIDYRRSLGRVLVDAADSFFNWDTKFIKSLGILLIRPWRLTNDFNTGRRVRYVHPLRLYLLASIAFFLIVKLINLQPEQVGEITPETRAEVEGALSKLTSNSSPLGPEQRAKLESLRERWSQPETLPLSRERRLVNGLAEKLPRYAEKETLRPKDVLKLNALIAAIPDAPPPALPNDGTTPPPAPSVAASPHSTMNFHFASNDGDPQTPFEKWMEGRIKQKVGEDGTNAQLFLDTLRNNIPTMMLCCIPLFALVLKVLYIRQRRYYVEHLVYALHIHTFAYVAVVVITLIALAVGRWSPTFQPVLATLLSLVAAGMVFVSIRRVYRQGWFATSFKLLLGSFAYFVVLVFAVAVTAFITLLLPS